jgi:phenylalanyl-tRNA synthetase alpha chain
MKTTIISMEQLRHAVNLRDLSNPAEGTHAMQLILNDILAALQAIWGCEVMTYRGNPIVSIADNYDRLHYPEGGASRDARYSRYVCETALLRTQMSAMVPRAMQSAAANLPADILLACPGMVYRRDSVDRIHSAEPHHLDLWRLTSKGPMTSTNLKETVGIILNAVLPNVEWKLEHSPHPYTLEGVEINAKWEGQWLEVGECGLAHPEIIRENIPNAYGVTGLALGMGLDRLLMVRKGIKDIRLLRSVDPRVTAQMQDLSPYREVSAMPPVTRDLSLVLDNAVSNEELGDKVREALGSHADIVELVEILSETPYSDLPPQAMGRLGIAEGQKNILLRVILRALDRTLTTEECNIYRDTIYKALHQGSVWDLIEKTK